MTRGYAAVGLYHPKTPVNIGSVLRAAGCFGAAMVAVEGQRYRRATTDTMAAYRHMPLLQVPSLHDAIPYDCVPVAIELVDGAAPLETYVHPERAFYVFGPEDGSLGKPVLSWCRDVVVISTDRCVNLAAAVNIVLYDRSAKRAQMARERSAA
jgi:tRNA(Leu) C34 or U34 (ribose-2'-O)-methylase TrmL